MKLMCVAETASDSTSADFLSAGPAEKVRNWLVVEMWRRGAVPRAKQRPLLKLPFPCEEETR